MGEGWCWCGKRFIWEERNFWAVEFLLHAGGLFHLGSFFSFPPPNPSHARTLRKKGAELAREGDFYFQNNIKFFKGAGLGCRLGRSWTVPTGHQDPLPPKGILSPGSLFYFVLFGSWTRLPLWGRCHAGGVTEGVPFQKIPTPCPLPLLQYVREVDLPQREGDLIFLKIEFFQGAPVSAAASVGPGRCPLGTRTPFPPRARLVRVRRLTLCFLEGRTEGICMEVL